MEKTDKFWLIQESIYENIKFADTKAGSLVALNLAIITAMEVLTLFENDKNIILFIIACISFMFLIVSILCSVKVLWPRGNKSAVSDEDSLCDVNKIAKLKSHEKYKKNVLKSDDKQLLKDIALFIYDRSLINKEKYKWFKIGIKFGIIGWIICFLSVSWKILYY